MEKREKKVTFSQFQKLGKVLMTPVMILPIAGILVGIGSAFTTKNIVALWPVLGNTYVKLFFNLLKAMGNTINSYLPIIFAVSVAIGYAEKEKGIAALSSVIGFLAMNNVMNILLTSLGILDPAAMKTGQSMVMGIASLDTGVFGGILVGLLVAKLHNKYYNIQLPPVLGIFSGTKFVPMISLLACSALGLVMSVVWPFVQTGLGFMGEIIYDTGMAGSVIYGLAERALLPFGLHHFIYTPFFFTNLGGSMVIDGTLYEGAVNIYNAMLASPDAMFDVNITRFIMNGKVIFAMFGLPGAALAMYHCAKPERKPQVKALLIAFACMLIYIAIRFDVFSGVSALLALVHDVLIMCAFMVFFRSVYQVNSSFIAAILTIVGYSINNTIIIFDRIRENAKKAGLSQLPRMDIVETSVSTTLSRTINTSLTTLITLVTLYIFGVEAIREFAFPLIVGMLAGSYSSMLLSGQVWAMWMDRRAAKQASQKASKKA